MTAIPRIAGDGPKAQWATSVLLSLFFVAPLALLFLGRVTSLASKLPSDEPTSAEERPPRTRSASEEREVRTLLARSQELLAREDANAALIQLARAVSLAPESAEIHNNLCVAFGIRRERDPAVGECLEALRLKPSYALAQGNLRWVSTLSKAPSSNVVQGKVE